MCELLVPCPLCFSQVYKHKHTCTHRDCDSRLSRTLVFSPPTTTLSTIREERPDLRADSLSQLRRRESFEYCLRQGCCLWQSRSAATITARRSGW